MDGRRQGRQSSRSKTRPRSRLTRKSGPSSACAAVAPRQTTIRGRTISISFTSQGRQAAMCRVLGFS